MNPKIIEIELCLEDMYEKFYPKLKENVFHYTSGKNLNSILDSGKIEPTKEGIQKTSIHSNESMGKELNAVCLFDLRDKSKEKIEKIRGWYNFLSPRFEDDTIVYLIFSRKFYNDVITIDKLDEKTKNKAMYLPDIESWHLNDLPLEKIEFIYKVKIAAQ